MATSSPVCVATVRNPHDSARSYSRMMLGPNAARASLIGYFSVRWQTFMLAILDYFERNPEHAVICYEELLREPAAQALRLCRFLDRCFGLTEGEEERTAGMVAAIDPALWRNKAATSFFDLAEPTEAQKDLLRYLHLRAADARQPFAPELFPFPPYHQEYLENFELLLT